jgi:hypothetical protein
VRIEDKDIPDGAVATFEPTKRRADSLNLVAEKRVICRLRPGSRPPQSLHYFTRVPDFEYTIVGGGVGWWAPNREIGYPGVPGYLGEFFVAGLVERGERSGEWSRVRLTQAGEFLFAVWRRDRDRAREAYYAEQDQLDAGLGPKQL